MTIPLSVTVVEAKRTLRAQALAHRDALAARHGGEAAAMRFLEAVPLSPASIVAGYWPMRNELDPRPLLRRLNNAGHQCALCVVDGRRRPLTFRHWQPGMALEPGVFGTAVPPASAGVLTPNIVLTPLLAFDEEGYRLGYGGGYYDRTLAGLRASGGERHVAVGLAYEGQRVESVPHDAPDQRLDWIITEARVRHLAVATA